MASTGARPRCGGLLAPSDLLSMWVSDTATAVIVLPVLAEVIAIVLVTAAMCALTGWALGVSFG